MGYRKPGVEKRPSSIRLRFTWEGRARWPTLMLNGVPMPPTPANLRYAERLAAEIGERIRLGTFSFAEYFPAGGDSGEELTVARQLDGWLATERVEASTRAGYESAIKFWKTAIVEGLALGARPLRATKHSHILAALATKPKLSGKTVNNYVSVGRKAIALAVRDGAIADNPFDGVERAAWQKDPPDPFTPDEREAIIDWMHRKAPAPVANLVQFWFWTGLRTSEIAGLRWPSVDLRSGAFEVHEALVRGAAKERTKTARSRMVLLSPEARAALERQAAHTRLANEHVFLDPRYGTPWTEERAFRRSFWTPCLKQLGIRYRRPYQMRHTYATAMLMAPQGMMNPAFCARQLGHSVKVFLDTYSRWIDGVADAAEMAKLSAPSSPAVTRSGS